MLNCETCLKEQTLTLHFNNYRYADWMYQTQGIMNMIDKVYGINVSLDVPYAASINHIQFGDNPHNGCTFEIQQFPDHFLLVQFVQGLINRSAWREVIIVSEGGYNYTSII